MRTDELIESLALSTRPVDRHAVRRSLLLTVGGAAVVSLFILLLWLGMRPDLHSAMRTGPFWMKAGYTVALAVSGFWLTLRLARPDGAPRRGWLAPAFVVAILALLAALQMATTPHDQWRSVWMGHSWMFCPWRIVVIAIPVFVGLTLALRRLAPTRLVSAGAAAGLLAGAVGASVYGLACDETAATFTLAWYSLGIGLCALAGALAGPRLLSWK
jgi:hypothetical protein